MSRQINQPINQVRLTNVAVVRYNLKGKRFEVACYRNKILDYRAGLETDVSEVLQTDRVFSNVSKGRFAKSADLQDAFGTRNQEEIAVVIMKKGNVQVSHLEREQMYGNTLMQIATWVAANCVHSQTQRPFTNTHIQEALKKYSMQPNKPMKKQCLDAVKFLQTVLPMQRAKMQVSLQYATFVHESTVSGALESLDGAVVVEEKKDDGETLLVLQIDPSSYRDLNELAGDVNGRLEILQQVVVQPVGEGGRAPERQQQQQNESQALQQRQAAEDNEPDIVEDAVVGASNENDENQQQFAQDLIDELDEKDEEDAQEDDDVEGLIERLQASRYAAVQNDESDEEDVNAPRKKKKNKKKGRKNKQQNQQSKPAEPKQPEAPAGPSCNVVGSDASNQPAAAGGKKCTTCGGNFASASDFRQHFKSDWHRFNLKLKLKGMPPVSEKEFELCDYDAFFSEETS